MKRFSFLLILRLAFILLNVLILGWIFGDMRLFFNQIILGLILTFQIWELIHYINHTNRELARLFTAVKHGDFSVTFNQTAIGKSFKELQQSMGDIMQSFKQVKIEKEAQYQFLQMLVNQIQIGIISLQYENIILINPIAEKLLNIQGVRNWKLVENQHPHLAAELTEEGKKLIEVKSQEGTKMLAAEISSMTLLDTSYKLITLQDINSEIEQKEIEAWHKLIRILTHEIMNSVTPISSLSETMQGMLCDPTGHQKALHEIEHDTITDIRFSLNTIQKRSERLLEFIENYRRLTRIPKPVLEPVDVQSFLESIKNLMREELSRQTIQLRVEVKDSGLSLNMDRALMEQVILNLIKNSIDALRNRDKKLLELKAYFQEEYFILEVKDNGSGIPEKELKEIFIPFFSTKKEGSGIGLSLSKQIMSLHGGRMRVSSAVNEGTSFFMMFKKSACSRSPQQN